MTSRGAPWVLLALVFATLARGGTAAAQPPPSNVQPPKPTAQESAAVEQRLSEAVRRDPGSFQAQQALAGFYLQQGKLEAAIPHLERAQAIDPAHYANSYDLALALLQTGKLNPAREQVQRMLSAKETGELHNLLGDVEERAGNLVAAAEEYQRAAHMDPTEDHLFDWGNNLVQLRAFEPATEVFSSAIARYPKSARLHVGLGIAQVPLEGNTRTPSRRSVARRTSHRPIRAPTSFSARCTASFRSSAGRSPGGLRAS